MVKDEPEEMTGEARISLTKLPSGDCGKIRLGKVPYVRATLECLNSLEVFFDLLHNTDT